MSEEERQRERKESKSRRCGSKSVWVRGGKGASGQESESERKQASKYTGKIEWESMRVRDESPRMFVRVLRDWEGTRG